MARPFESAVLAPYVDEVLRRVTELVGQRLCGVWLVGSIALGDFAPERSDIDIQAVSTVRLALGERERLAAALSHDALPCPARGLEFVLYAREDLDEPAGPAYQLNLNTGPRMAQHVAFEPDADPRFWFVIDVSIARQHGRRLAGPAAASFLPPLPRPLVLRSLREALAWYADHDASAVETVLGACRTWAWVTDGLWRSKADSARWARARLADPAPVDKALLLRDGAAAPPPTGPEVAAVLAAAHAALDAAASGPHR